ncbi:MAG TPA: polysaccharide biosynthesis C-terminal domain-containing protein, partial [Bacteroidales bacterium]|nr:polysaccharide biosynthesis C-terminal domain-containing protein [Bacteroidales bacterium]
MKPVKQLAGQTVVYGLSTIVPRFLNYLLVPLYTWYFLPEEYGVVTEFYAYVLFLNIVLTYGMETGYFKFSQDNQISAKVYSTILTSIISSSFIFALATILFAAPVASGLGYAHHPEYIWIFGLIISIDAVCAIPFVKLRKENKALKFASIKIANVAINILLNICFIILFPKLIKMGIHLPRWIYNPSFGVGYIFVSNLIASIVTLLIVSPQLTLKGGFDKSLLKQLLVYSLPLLFAGLAGSINEALDRVLIKHLLPDNVNALEQLGIYGANIKIAVVLVLFVQTFRFAAEPFFFNYEKEKDSKAVFAKILNYFAVTSLIILMATLVNIDVVKYFIGRKYWEGLYIVPILLFANVFFGIYVYLSSWYKLSGKTMYGAYIVAIGAALTIAVNTIFVPVFGIIAAAWGHFSCYFIMTITCYLWGKKYYPIPYETKRILKYLALALVFVLVAMFMPLKDVLLRIVAGNTLLIIFSWL